MAVQKVHVGEIYNINIADQDKRIRLRYSNC
jgi:hypothetical protein